MVVEPNAAPDGETGATLIELLIGVVLTGIILIGVTAGAMTYLLAGNTTRYLLSETPELQLASTRFASDVQSSATVVKPALGTAPSCGTLPAGAGSTTLVDFTWTDPRATPATTDDLGVTRVSYTYAPTTNELRRAACLGVTLVEETTLVSRMQPAIVPELQCDDGCFAPGRLDLELNVCTASGTSCLDDSIPAHLYGVRRLPS